MSWAGHADVETVLFSFRKLGQDEVLGCLVAKIARLPSVVSMGEEEKACWDDGSVGVDTNTVRSLTAIGRIESPDAEPELAQSR